MTALGIGIGVAFLNSTVPFSVLSLFAAGEVGVWYDPSDLTTMFQDAAGTTPVTAVEQPVGLILDKSGRGNHGSQSTAASRPVLSARVNLLTYTEQFDNAVWQRIEANITANATTAPDGTSTADLLVATTVSAGHFIYNTTFSQANGTCSICAKPAGYNWLALGIAGIGLAWFNVSTGVVGTVQAGLTAAITPAGNGFYRCSISWTAAATRVNVQVANIDNQTAAWTGDGTSGIYIWGIDLRATNDGVSLPGYQRVVTGTTADYDTAGFPLYLRFDGTDDSLATGSIDFSGTDKMSVFAGVRKLSDAAVKMLYELSADGNSNNGIIQSAPGYSSVGSTVGAYWHAGAKGTTLAQVPTSGTYAAPISAVQSHLSDIAGSSQTLRINGVQAATSASSLGTGNFGNYPLYIGRRGGSTLPFNGRLYALIVRGAASSAAQIASAETWINSKCKAF